MDEKIDEQLHSEIRRLFQYVQRLREEISGIAGQQNGQTAFSGMSDRLDAIVASTSHATDTILESVEAIGGAVNELRADTEGDKRDQLCDLITENANQALEACSFQDLTGQRVSKIVRSMKFIEERVDALADLLGRQEVEALGGGQALEEESPDGVALCGPQAPGDAISQEEIDKLFD